MSIDCLLCFRYCATYLICSIPIPCNTSYNPMRFSGKVSQTLWKAYVENGKAAFNLGPCMTAWSRAGPLLCYVSNNNNRTSILFQLLHLCIYLLQQFSIPYLIQVGTIDYSLLLQMRRWRFREAREFAQRFTASKWQNSD